MNSDIQEMKTDISDIKSTQARHEEIIKKQNQIIELLSVKSIDQESDIRAVKKDLVKQDTTIGSLVTRSLVQEDEIRDIKGDKEAS